MAKIDMEIKIDGKKYPVKYGIGYIESAVEAENPEDHSVFNIPTSRRIFHAIRYGLERQHKDVPEDLLYTIQDWIDEVGLQSEEILNFNIKLGESMKTHIDDDNKEEYEKALKEIKSNKKKNSKSGSKTGKKT